jgi:simple sugar transport system permease protein
MEELLAVSVLAAAIRASTPLVFAGLGELVSEKGGVLNLGVEGIMLVSALSGYVAAHASGSLTLAVFAAALAGGALSLLHGWICISLRGNQIVSGLAITILGGGLSGYLGRRWIGTAPELFFSVAPIPFLSDLPIIGPVLFKQNILVYVSYLLVPLIAWILYKTAWGLSVRACGENPAAADIMGVDVARVRYLCVLLGGMLMGVAGIYLSLAYTHMWGEDMCGGRGWIAIALVIFSGWKPLRLMWGAYLFGGIEAIQLRCQASGKFTYIPVYFLMMLPYLFTIAILVFSKLGKNRDDAPLSLALPFHREAAN